MNVCSLSSALAFASATRVMQPVALLEANTSSAGHDSVTDYCHRLASNANEKAPANGEETSWSRQGSTLSRESVASTSDACKIIVVLSTRTGAHLGGGCGSNNNIQI